MPRASSATRNTECSLNTWLTVRVATTMISMAGRMITGSEVSSNTATSAASGACNTAAIIAPMPSMTYSAGADGSPRPKVLPK